MRGAMLKPAQTTRIAPSKSVALPVVANVYQQQNKHLTVYDTYHVSYSHLAGMAEIEILEILGRVVKTTNRQRAWEVLVYLCAHIKYHDDQTPFINELKDTDKKIQHKAVALSRGTKEHVLLRQIPVVDWEEPSRKNYFGYMQGRLVQTAIGNMGLEDKFATGFRKIVPGMFAKKLHSFGVDGFPQAVKLYIRMSLRLQTAVGCRVAASLDFNRNDLHFATHIGMFKSLLNVDVDLLTEINRYVLLVSSSLPPHWHPVIMNLYHFFQDRRQMHQAMFAQLQWFDNRPDLELSNVFFVARAADGETYLGLTSPVPGQPGSRFSNLSLYHPLDVTIDSAHWRHLREMINQAIQFPEFRTAALLCMDENRLYLQNKAGSIGVQQQKYLFGNVKKAMAKDEDAILNFIASIAFPLIVTPMQHLERDLLWNIMGSAAANA